MRGKPAATPVALAYQYKRNTLVMELVQSTVGIPTRVVVIPASGMEDMSVEVLDATDSGQLRPIGRSPVPSPRTGHELSSPRFVLNRQRLIVFIPAHRANLGGEDRAVVEPEMLCDATAVLG